MRLNALFETLPEYSIFGVPVGALVKILLASMFTEPPPRTTPPFAVELYATFFSSVSEAENVKVRVSPAPVNVTVKVQSMFLSSTRFATSKALFVNDTMLASPVISASTE